MSRDVRQGGTVLALALLAVLLPIASRADRAVVVGVQQYAHLKRGQALNGCVHDARAMKQALERYGFQVTLLLDSHATCQAILDAVHKTESEIGPAERFVFYFAGHGDGAPQPCLLPYDASESATDADLTATRLREAVHAIRARARTVILDSCFSGGMAKSVGRPGLRARYYPRGFETPAGAKSPSVHSRRGANEQLSGGVEDVFYYTASQGDEKAHEMDFDGGTSGVFTHFLTRLLTGDRTLLWGDIQKQVKSEVENLVGNVQHPELGPGAYTLANVFEGTPGGSSATGSPAGASADVLWDAYNSDNPDPQKVLLAMEPDKLTFEVGERNRLHIQVGLPGYLVILDRDVDGKVYVLYPHARADGFHVDDSHVEAGMRSIPADPRAEPNYFTDAGNDHLKAILFTSGDAAQALLNGFRDNNTGILLTGAKRLAVPTATKAPFYTHDVTFEVTKKEGAAKP